VRYSPLLSLPHSLTRRSLASAYTSKVLTRIPPLKRVRKIDTVVDFQQPWVTSLPPGLVFGTCLGEQNGVYFPSLASAIAFLQRMISRVNPVGICSYTDVYSWLGTIQGCMGEA